MSRPPSFITLLWLIIHALAMPLTDDDECDEPVVSTTPAVRVPSAAVLGPHPPTPHPSPSKYPHATIPVSHRGRTPAILGAVIGILIALSAVTLVARYFVRRRRTDRDPFKDPPKSKFTVLRLAKSTAPKKRLSDESWVSPTLPSPASPVSQDPELRRYAHPRRKLVPVTTPVCTPTDIEFGSRLDSAGSDPNAAISVPPVRVPSPVYISPFSPSPSISSSSSTVSPAPSTEPLSSSSPARLSRLLFSTFRDTRVTTSPARPTTAHLIQTARSYAHAYRSSSATSTSLYTPPTPSTRFSGTRSRTGFHLDPTYDTRAAWGRVRDTFCTMTTSDTDMVGAVPHLSRAMVEGQPSTSPSADPNHRNANRDKQIATGSVLDQPTGTEGQTKARTQVGTSLVLKLRLSDASEHARYRSRERERQCERQRSMERGRERERELENECAAQRLSTDSQTSASSMETMHGAGQWSQLLEAEVDDTRKEFKLRDSEGVLREIGW